MVPAVKSLLIHSDVDEIYLYIEDDEFPKKYGMPGEVVKVRNAKDQKYFDPDGPNMNSRFTYMAMMRATFAKEFPKDERILSLDVDTIVDKDICELWDLPLDDGDGYYLAATYEPERSDMEGYFYTNIGVCLYNLSKLRDGKCDEVIKALNTKEYKYLEQDAFNELCQDQIYSMPPEYNSNWFTKLVDIPKIVHYAGIKKWSDKNLVKKYADLEWGQTMKYRESRLKQGFK